MTTKDTGAQHTPGRTLDQISRDLASVRKLGRREKKELGGVTPRTMRRMSELLSEAEAICAIEYAIDPRTLPEKTRAAIAKATKDAP